jgi:hypothetical protein
MKKNIFPVLLLFVVLTMNGQTKRAKANETVWLCTYKVKADKRQQYEHFIHDIFWKGASKLSGNERKVFSQTRIMHPEKMEKDGTYLYSFLMDPVIKNADYGIFSLIKKMYGAKKGAEYYKLFEGAITKESDYTQINMIQSKD